MLDRYIEGTITRESPEAPVPIISQEKSVNKLGGAANVGLNIHALSGTVSLISVIGEDEAGNTLNELLQQSKAFKHIELLKDKERITTSKTRLIADNQHVARIDKEVTHGLSDEKVNQIIESLNKICTTNQVDLLLLQDYNKGIFTPLSIKKILAYAKKNQLAVAVDPKKENFFSFQDISIFKPNLNELTIALGNSYSQYADNYKNLIKVLQNKIEAECVVITLGANGLLIADKHEAYHISGLNAQEIDVCGAGDSVIAALSLSFLKNEPIQDMGSFANTIGFLSCLNIGVNPVKGELYAAKLPSLKKDIKVQKL